MPAMLVLAGVLFLLGGIAEELSLTTGLWPVGVGSGVGGCWLGQTIPRVRWSDRVRVWAKACGRRGSMPTTAASADAAFLLEGVFEDLAHNHFRKRS